MAEINDARVETDKDHEGDIESLNYCLIFGVKVDVTTTDFSVFISFGGKRTLYIQDLKSRQAEFCLKMINPIAKFLYIKIQLKQ